MWEKLLQLVKELVFVNELSRRNSDEIKDLRNRMDELQRFVERLVYRIDRNEESEALKREKLLLQIENLLAKHQISVVQKPKEHQPRSRKQLPKKKNL